MSHLGSESKLKKLKNQDYKCFYCKREIHTNNSTTDHIIPSSKGGIGYQYNLVITCEWCNSRKADLNADLFVNWLKSLEDHQIGNKAIKFVPESEKTRRRLNRLKTLRKHHKGMGIDVDKQFCTRFYLHRSIKVLKGLTKYLANKLKKEYNGVLHKPARGNQGNLFRKRRFEAGKSCLDKQQRFFAGLFGE